MKIAKTMAAAALAACMAGAPRPAAADDIDAVARGVAAKSAKSVVTVKLVIKLKAGGREQEEKLEIVGTVIDPSGLTLVSASAIEPTAMLGGAGGRRGGRGGGAGGGGEAPRIESEVGETAIVLDDGTEVEADVVLKDQDLDLAFIRPREAQKLPAVELKPRGRAPELLEHLFTVTRLDRAEGRATAVVLGAVKAVVKGPRTFYVCTREVSTGTQGCVAYGADGAPLGVFVVKLNAPAEGGGGRGRGAGGLASTILRPVEDVLEIVKQAKDAKAPEKKAAPAPADEAKSGETAGKEGEKKAETR
jgi:hypothetical protein